MNTCIGNFMSAEAGRRFGEENWKLVRYNVFNPEETTTELYDLDKDLGEENNVAEQHSDIVKELSEIMNNARTESEIFTFKSRGYLQ